MSNILVASSPASGHVKPMLTIAAHLKSCGHRITFNTDVSFRPQVDALDLTFVPLFGKAAIDSSHEVFLGRQNVAPGVPQLIYDTQHLFGDPIPDQYLGLRQITDREDIDIILADAFFLGVFPYLLGPKESRPPIVSCGVFALMMQTEEASPFAGVDRTPEGRRRNIEHNRQQMEDLAPASEYINAVLKSCGAPPSPSFYLNDAYTLPDLLLQCGTRDFDFGLEKTPANMRFVGPIQPPPHSDFEAPAWWNELDGSKPIVFVTQGTVANYDFDQLVNPTLAALAHEDVTVVCTAGGGDVSLIKTQPNVKLEKYLPYDQVLPKAAVFVTNAGYNGVQQALSMGVPIVAAGATEDKPQVSARLAWTGAGIDLQTGNPTPEQVRDAVRRILANDEYKKRAKLMQKSYAQYDALKSIGAAVEEMLDKKTSLSMAGTTK